jgi:protein SCO1/2
MLRRGNVAAKVTRLVGWMGPCVSRRCTASAGGAPTPSPTPPPSPAARGPRPATTADAEAERLEQDVSEEEADKAALRRYGKYALGAAVLLAWAKYCNDLANARYGRQDEGSVRTSVTVRGKPSLGGPFTLVNTKGEPMSQAEFLGQWTFFYFGFVHCPEICPVELNRMTKVVDAVRAANGKRIQPMFVSCDPKRDSLEAVEEYLSVFHPDFVGLVGTPKQTDEVCKSYRIYYSMPDPEAAKTTDYLIDHSIAIFLFDPQGRFVDFFGNRYDEHEMTEKVITYMANYDKDPEWTNY